MRVNLIFLVQIEDTRMAKKNCEINPNNLSPTVKHSGGSVMVCMSARGIGKLYFIEGTINHKMYIDILKNNLAISAEKLENSSFNKTTTRNNNTANNIKNWLFV